MATMACSIRLTVAEGVKHPVLSLKTEVNQAWVQHQTSQQPLIHCQGNLPEGLCLTVFEGKGGTTLLLESEVGHTQDLLVFALPGSKLAFKNGCQIEFFTHATLSGKPDVAPPVASQPARQNPAGQNPAGVQAHTPQAMILGAGIGTRILPLTDTLVGLAKPALPLDGQHTVIGRIAQHLNEHGFQQLFVNTFYQRPSVWQALQQAIEGTDAQLNEIPEHRATGTAGGLVEILKHPEKYPTFNRALPILIMQGDAVTDADLSALVQTHVEKGAVLTIGCQIVSDADVDKFGIIATQAAHSQDPSGPITRFLEKPSLSEAGPHRLGSTGFYVLSPAIYPLLESVYETKLRQDVEHAKQTGQAEPKEAEEIDFAKDLFPEVLRQCEQGTLNGPMWAQVVPGYWCDIGNPAQYLETLQALYTHQLPLPELDINANAYDQGVVFWPDAKPLAEHVGLTATGNVIVGRKFKA